MSWKDYKGLKAHIAGREFAIAKSLIGNLTDGNGKDRNQGCPICGEGKSKSRFYFRSDGGTFHCRKCNFRSGDIIALVGRVRGVSMGEAFDIVAAHVGYGGASAGSPVRREPERKSEPPPPSAFPTFPLDGDSPIFQAVQKCRPEITFATYQRVGAKLFRVGRNEGIAIPMFAVDGVLSGWVCYGADGSKRNTKGSNSGFVGTEAIHSLRRGQQAKIVFKTAGVSDYLILLQKLIEAGLEGDYFGFTTGAGENERPEKFEPLLHPALTGQTVAVIADNDEAGATGAQRWAESIAEYGGDVYIIELPPVIFDCDIKDLRDFFAPDAGVLTDLFYRSTT
jgi:hypothetical protein